jgi:uncharacterized membrane protein
MDDPVLKPEHAGVSLRTIAVIAYGLFALGFITSGLLAFATIAAVIIIFIKRPDATGTIYASHFDWLMSTFLWSLLWMALSLVATLIFIGWLGLFATVIWVLYRLIRGFLALLDGRAIDRR